MALDERHRVLAIAATHDTISASTAVIPACERIEDMPFEVKIQTHQIPLRTVDTVLDFIRSRVALHKRNLRFGMFVIVPVVPVIEAITLVVPKSVVVHHIAHPLQVRDKHLLHIYIVMRPVTCTVPVIAVVHTTGRCSVTIARLGIQVHFIILAYITCIRLEDTILAKIHLVEIAPRAHISTMVDHDIRHHLGTGVMQRTNQRFQLRTRSPVRVLIAILLGMIPRSFTIRAGR